VGGLDPTSVIGPQGTPAYHSSEHHLRRASGLEDDMSALLIAVDRATTMARHRRRAPAVLT
jgi:hypothetical protein